MSPPRAFTSVSVAIVLCGCGTAGWQVASKPTTLQGHRISTRWDRSPSWIDPRAKSADLLYLSDEGTNDVYVYSWPGGAPMGKLTGLQYPQGLCTDGLGNLYVTDYGASEIVEYPHGGSRPITTLADPGSYFPSGCSVDPSTGNLAVTNFESSYGAYGNVAIYRHARGTPKVYSEPFVNYYYCSYDSLGNLYVNHTNEAGYAIAVLPKGRVRFTDTSLDQAIDNLGGLQWDGTYLAVGDSNQAVIYRFAINARRTRGTKVGSVPLDRSSWVLQFAIERSVVIGPNAGLGNAMVWNYPIGGQPTKTFGGLVDPVGAAVSYAR